jgi:hypothetical protein
MQLTAPTASGRAWSRRLALKYARYSRGEPATPATPSHSPASATCKVASSRKLAWTDGH